jgi:hypothetical protein
VVLSPLTSGGARAGSIVTAALALVPAPSGGVAAGALAVPAALYAAPAVGGVVPGGAWQVAFVPAGGPVFPRTVVDVAAFAGAQADAAHFGRAQGDVIVYATQGGTGAFRSVRRDDLGRTTRTDGF